MSAPAATVTDMADKTHALVFIDTETTSLRSDRLPWEVAIVRREPDGAESEHVLQVRLELDDLARATPQALQVGRFDERYPDSPLPGEQAVARLAQLLDDATPVGVNVGFDTGALTVLFDRYGTEPTWHHIPYDLPGMTRVRLSERGQRLPAHERSGSYQLSRMVGVEPPAPDVRHTALGDARWARDWFDMLDRPRPRWWQRALGRRLGSPQG